MAWNFRRRVKIIPGVHLNFSKNGISTSIGVKGDSITLGKSGTYLNTGIPGLGLYNRQKLVNGSSPSFESSISPQQLEPYDSKYDNIFSAAIHEITSQDMQGIKEAILIAREQRLSLEKDISKIRIALTVSKIKKAMSYLLIYGLINKSIPEQIDNDLKTQREALKQTKEQKEVSYVNFEVDFDTESKFKYEELVTTFIELTRSRKIWDVTSAHFEDRRITRSSASTIVKRNTVSFGLKSIPEFKSDVQALFLQNANGADLYIYPNFIVMYSKNKDFAVIGLDEISMEQNYVRFTETQGVPADTKIIEQTWAKVNKNGSRDKRFKGNYQIPVVRYGELKLKTTTGVHEEYQFSNYEATVAFDQAFREYQQSIKQLV